MTATEIADLGRIAGMLEGKRFVEAFQPFAKHNEWCLRFDVAEIGISIRPGEYDPSERIVEEVRRQLALVSATMRSLRSQPGIEVSTPENCRSTIEQKYRSP
jgi:hypothetical protein